MKRAAWILVVATLGTGACGRDTGTSPADRHPIPEVVVSSEEEELIGGYVLGASGGTVYTASGAGSPMYFTAQQNKHRWGVFIDAYGCPDSEQHFTNSSLTPPTGPEEHCGVNGAYEVSVSGGGRVWSREIAMLDARGVLGEIPNNNIYHDVLVPVDVRSPSTVLSGTLRQSTTYYAATDTAAFSTGGASVTTGDSVWFISTYTSQGDGIVYGTTSILNSYNFDYARSGQWQPAVNSSNALDGDRSLPFLHVFRSPGRTRDLTVKLRVVEPYHASMASGRVTSDAVVVSVAADSACWTSAGGNSGAPVSFSASCSESRNAGIAEYQWDFGDGPPTAWDVNNSTSHVFAAPGTKTVTLRIRLSTGEAGMDSTAHTVEITAPPITGVTISGLGFAAAGPVRSNWYCSWRATVTGGTAPFSYVWETAPTYKDVWTEVGTTRMVDVFTGTANFRLRVSVTDAYGQGGSQSVDPYVTVSPSGTLCP